MKTPAMKTPALSTVYLDNASVGLMGDPRPSVSKILAAGGKHPGMVTVVRARSPGDRQGQPLSMQDVIDRTSEPTRPIYLRSRPNAVSVGGSQPTVPSSVFIEFPSPDDGKPRPLGSPLPEDDFLPGGRG